jgi:threonylcarbamoyladenosine tRNA methylthiotransferase MtaB
VGCRTNQQEITLLEAELAARGHRVVDDVAEAAVVVVNTCSVTACSESKTRRLIGALSRRAPGARMLVTGCLAQQRPELLAGDPRVFWVVGNAHKERIVSLIDSPERGVYHSRPDAPVWGGWTVPEPAAVRRTRFPLKIQEGCDYRCAYCIVPALRGPARSRPWDDIVEGCARAGKAGFREIVVTGTHIGQYRDRGRGLTELVEELAALDGDFRIRLSSLDPREISPRLLALAAGESRVCPHIHVSVQSLCGPVLESMRRPYADLEALVGTLRDLRCSYPHVALGADCIVGFPGESASMFATTVERVEEIGFSHGHVFRYSPRPGTPAATLPEQVEEREKRRRSEVLRATFRATHRRFVEGLTGALERIIVEKEQPVTGVTGNYLRTEVPGARAARGEWLTVVLGGYDAREERCRAEAAPEEDA